jgi:hypothetical protein
MFVQIGNMNLNGEMMMPYAALDVWQDIEAGLLKFVSKGIQFPTTYGDVIFYGGTAPAQPFPISLGYVDGGPYERTFLESDSTYGGTFGEELLAHVTTPLGTEIVYYMNTDAYKDFGFLNVMDNMWSETQDAVKVQLDLITNQIKFIKNTPTTFQEWDISQITFHLDPNLLANAPQIDNPVYLSGNGLTNQPLDLLFGFGPGYGAAASAIITLLSQAQDTSLEYTTTEDMGVYEVRLGAHVTVQNPVALTAGEQFNNRVFTLIPDAGYTLPETGPTTVSMPSGPYTYAGGGQGAGSMYNATYDGVAGTLTIPYIDAVHGDLVVNLTGVEVVAPPEPTVKRLILVGGKVMTKNGKVCVTANEATPPAPVATIINLFDIPGVTSPVKDAIPVTTNIDTEQYTGTVAWSPAHNPFQAGTVYTALIEITAKPGYTLTGVLQNSFVVNGITSTHGASSGSLTVTFPATAAAA